ncbi:MAG: hypothetical protein ACTSRS_22375 [Candidatus Helarchaeota archaeon]
MLGEIEKRINKKFPKYEYGRNLDPDANWVIEEIIKILKEAKEEFPKPHYHTDYTAYLEENLKHLKNEEPLEYQEFPTYYIKPNYDEIEKWFKKWFGDE